MKISLFNYNLPKDKIAQSPTLPRDHCKLLILNKKITHEKFYNIIDHLEKGDTLVINQTKVDKILIKGKKSTGSPVQLIFSEKIDDKYYKCNLKTKNPKPNNILLFKDNLEGKIIKTTNTHYYIKFNKFIPLYLKKYGELPLPFYITHPPRDKSSYQTVYAKKSGSLASPTAGLHFTPKLLKKIKSKGINIAKITLHIGFGTFLPIRSEYVEEHNIHTEYFEINKAAAEIINNTKGRLIAVGTTSLRALESASKDKKTTATKKHTNIYIYPGYKFKSNTTGLITNFHLPKSTLLLLVSAFAGRLNILKAYKEAIKKDYKFYSFGDAMFIEKF